MSLQACAQAMAGGFFSCLGGPLQDWHVGCSAVQLLIAKLLDVAKCPAHLDQKLAQCMQSALTGQHIFDAPIAVSAVADRRDRLAVVTQLLVPLLLVLLAMAVSTLETQRPQQPPLQLTRPICLMGRPALFAAASGLRQKQEVQGFMDGYPRYVV